MSDKRDLIFSELKSDFLLTSENRDNYKCFLEILNEHRLFGCEKSSQILEAVGKINSALATKNGRLEGLSLLHHVLDQCSTEVFTQQSSHWVKLLIRILLTEDDRSVLGVACEVFDVFLKHLKSFPEVSHKFSSSSGKRTDNESDSLPSLISALLQLKDKDHSDYAVRLLSTCMTYYLGPCGPFVGKIEQFAVPLLDSRDIQTQQDVGRCLSLTSACGGGGNRGEKHTEAWSNLACKLVSSLHDTLDQLYSDLETGSPDYARPPPNLLRLAPVDLAEPARTCSLKNRFEGLCTALDHHLRMEFPAPAKVPVDGIYEAVYRAMSMEAKFLLARPNRQRILLASVLPFLHIAAMKVLTALMLGVGSLMVRSAVAVFRLLVHALQLSNTTQHDNYGHGRPYTELRLQTYATLTVWIQFLGNLCGVVDPDILILLKQATSDASPQTDKLKMELKSGHKLDQIEACLTAGGSKKKKRRLVVGLGGSDIGQLSAQRKHDLEANADVCVAALSVLRQIMLHFGPLLDSEHLREIENFFRPLMLIWNQPVTTGYPVPYSSALCRRAWYQVLMALMTMSNPRWPAPSQIILSVLKLGVLDPDLQVKSYCLEAMCICDTIIHPRVPALSSPLAAETGKTNCASVAGPNLQDNSLVDFVTRTHPSELSSCPVPSISFVFKPAPSTTEPLVSETFEMMTSLDDDERPDDNEEDDSEDEDESDSEDDVERMEAAEVGSLETAGPRRHRTSDVQTYDDTVEHLTGSRVMSFGVSQLSEGRSQSDCANKRKYPFETPDDVVDNEHDLDKESCSEIELMKQSLVTEAGPDSD